LDGQPQEAAVAVSVLLRSGTVQSRDGLLLECHVSDEAAASVAPDCTHVRLEGSHLRGGENLNLTVALRGRAAVAASSPFHVAYPQLPVEVTAQRSRLQPVSGWPRLGDESCQALTYQSTQVQVFATFAGDGRSQVVEVTGLLAVDQFSSSDLGVLEVRARSPAFPTAVRVRGVSPGSANIIVSRSGEELGRTSKAIQCVVEAAFVAQLDTHAVQELDVRLANEPVAHFQPATVAVTLVEAALKEEGARTQLVAQLVYEDGHTEPLEEADGLLFLTNDTARVVVLGSTVEVVPGATSGRGPLVLARFVPTPAATACPLPAVLAEAGVEVVLDLPAAVGLRVSGVPERLVVPGDVAESAGLPSAAALRVEVDFAFGSPRELTDDIRMAFDTNQSNGVFAVERSPGLGVRLVAMQAGVGSLRVDFDRGRAQAQVLVTVTATADLQVQAHPFPRFLGSDQQVKNVLQPIAGVLPVRYQKVALATTLVLADGHRLALPTELIGYTVASTGAGGGPLAAELADEGLVEGLAPGTVEVVARFAGAASAVPLPLTVLEAPVTVVGLSNFRLAAVPPAVLVGETLSGVAAVGEAVVQLAASLSDGTRRAFESGRSLSHS
jgi:hypothetical protein